MPPNNALLHATYIINFYFTYHYKLINILIYLLFQNHSQCACIWKVGLPSLRYLTIVYIDRVVGWVEVYS